RPLDRRAALGPDRLHPGATPLGQAQAASQAQNRPPGIAQEARSPRSTTPDSSLRDRARASRHRTQTRSSPPLEPQVHSSTRTENGGGREDIIALQLGGHFPVATTARSRPMLQSSTDGDSRIGLVRTP